MIASQTPSIVGKKTKVTKWFATILFACSHAFALIASAQTESDTAAASAAVATNIHDFTMLSIKAPKRVAITSGGSATKSVKVTIQNLGGHEEVVPSPDLLASLVTVTVTSLGACSGPAAVQPTPKQSFPLTLGLKKKLTVVFNVTFDCPADYSYFGSVYHSHLGGPLDDVGYNDNCPRSPDVVPGDKGCGSKDPATHQLGGQVLTHVFVK